ncbi:hypothetical protein U9M48_011507 [Paspalum notatum var. saurae]|uniref:Rx N-terminal domain-containing protein n=1 Tax=Paspalum notatum var. saurae TaxID=547442 RepID=A0AAQ3SWG4_PASNO
MAEIISSAVVQETVSQVISNLVQKYEEKEESNANRSLERLEMAHIRLEASLETSDKWQITDTSLLRWHRKLKRVAQECDDTLHKCKQRILEDKQVEHEVQNSSLPNRIIHATKSFVSSIFNRNDNGLIRPIVQRFEWYADGASEFLRFIELGGTPHRRMPVNSITRNLLSGKELYHKIFRGNEYPLLQLWLLPKRTSEHGIEANLVFLKKDIYFGMIVQLSESTDIFGIAVKSLQLFAPHVKCTVENIRNDLTQLPTQDFSWVPSVYSYQREHWDNLHRIGSQWFRPNPSCCKRHDQHQVQRFSNLDVSTLSDVSMEPLVQFSLRSQVSLSAYSKQKTSLAEETISLQDSPCLRAGLIFAPHGSSEDMLPVNNSSVTMAIVGGEQHILRTDITLEQLEEAMLPKAIDHFCQNAEATVYQMIWKSKHGFALIEFEKPSMRTRRTFRGAKKTKRLQGQGQDLIRTLAHIVSHSIGLWVTHVPVWLQRSFMNWMQKENEINSAVVQETVSQVLSDLVPKYEEKDGESNAKTNLERLEMAHIRLEAALEISDKWQISATSLLRWRRKLKRAAQECDDTLHRLKQRILEDEEAEIEVRKSSFPRRVAHATKSVVSSIFSLNNKDNSDSSAVRRFERFADGASEFLRFVEFGGTPCRHMPFDHLVRHLLTGKKLQYITIQANRCPLILLLAPYVTEEYGVEARLMIMQKDDSSPEDDFFLTLMLQLSESTDIVGITIRCLQLYGPLFKPTVERIRRELVLLPSQDISWVPNVDTHHSEHWDNHHRFFTNWFRPDPLCCKQHDLHRLCHAGSNLDMSSASGLLDDSLEPIIEVNLQCQVSLSECNKQRALLYEPKNPTDGSPYLKAGLLFTPHGCPADILPVDRSPAAIYSEEHHSLNADSTTWEQLQEVVVPKAIDYFCKNDQATIYQMLWRSKHGIGYIHFEMAHVLMPGRDEEQRNWTDGVSQFVNLWSTHAPIQLQGLIEDWIQKEEENQLEHRRCSTRRLWARPRFARHRLKNKAHGSGHRRVETTAMRYGPNQKLDPISKKIKMRMGWVDGWLVHPGGGEEPARGCGAVEEERERPEMAAEAPPYPTTSRARSCQDFRQGPLRVVSRATASPSPTPLPATFSRPPVSGGGSPRQHSQKRLLHLSPLHFFLLSQSICPPFQPVRDTEDP